MLDDKDFRCLFYFAISAMALIFIIAVMMALTSCCTLEFSNVMTSGTASDVVRDSDEKTTENDIKIPNPENL